MNQPAVPEVLSSELPAGAYLLDVREDEEWAAGHAPGAVHVRLGELGARFGELPRDREVYVICRIGQRSAYAAGALGRAGLNAINVADGMAGWAVAGRPMISEDGAEPYVAQPCVMDYVSVRGLSVPAVIGVRDWERDITQTLVFNVDMVPSARDVRRAAETDDLAEALDYSEVAQTISSVVRDGRFRLIETVAERVAARLLADHPIGWLRLEVHKPIAGGYTAVITIERAARPA